VLLELLRLGPPRKSPKPRNFRTTWGPFPVFFWVAGRPPEFDCCVWPETLDYRRPHVSHQSHLQILVIYKLGFGQNFYTFTLILLVRIVLCSEFPWTKFADIKCFDCKYWVFRLDKCWVYWLNGLDAPCEAANAVFHDKGKSYRKSVSRQNLSGIEGCCTNALLLPMNIMLCSKLHCLKGLIEALSYKIAGAERRARAPRGVHVQQSLPLVQGQLFFPHSRTFT